MSRMPLLQLLGRRPWVQQTDSDSHVVTINDRAWGNTKRRYQRGDSIRDRFNEVDVDSQPYEYEDKLLQHVEKGEFNDVVTILTGGHDVNVVDEETRMTALHIAAGKGNVPILQELLSRSANVNVQDSRGLTPLHFATMKNRLECCILLLETTNIDVNMKNKKLNTALHEAANEGRLEVCAMLLANSNVDVNVKNNHGLTPLHLAAKEDRPKVLLALLNNNADWNIQDKYSYLPIHYAALNGFDECCEILMNENERKEKQLTKVIRDGKTAMMLAAKNGHFRCCEKLRFININAKDKYGNTALHYAAKAGFEGTVSLLLNAGANPDLKNKDDVTPSHEAAAKKKAACLAVLHDHERKANFKVFDKTGKGLLHYAAEKNSEECMNYLLELDEMKELINNKNNDDCSAFHVAIKKEAVECALLLLENGASPTDESKGQWTPLHLAAFKGSTELCQKLLKKGVNVNKENEDRVTPLHLAAINGSTDVCQMLYRKGARLTAVSGRNSTALHLAAKKGHVNVVKFLGKRGAPVTAKDESGSTALHLAAASEGEHSLECCKALFGLSKAPNWDLDRDQCLPIDRAFEKNNDEEFKYLLMNLPYIEKHKEKMLKLHEYMEKALESKRIPVIEAIIESEWWTIGFLGSKHHQCYNFKTLLSQYPELALKVQDRCVDSSKSYDFRLFNDNCIFESDDAKSSSTFFTQVQSDTKLFREMSGLEWKTQHPLSTMVAHELNTNLHHPLTKAWVLQKWQAYMYAIFLAHLMLELFNVIFLTVFLSFVDNWNHIFIRCNNLTHEDFINASQLYNQNSSDPALSGFVKCTQNTVAKRVCWGLLLAITCITLLQEINYCCRLKSEYFRILGNTIRMPRLLCTFVILAPPSYGHFGYMVLNVDPWQCGVVAILLAWLYLINSLNEIPMFSVFMPITNKFIGSFFKVICYILLILFCFAFIFHLLLWDIDAFKTMHQSMIKTTVWLLGDLAYDDTFLEKQLYYPVMVNLLFMTFVTVIGGFIINLIISQPSDKLDNIREKASQHYAKNRVKLFLRLDVCYPWCRKTKTSNTFVENGKHHNFLTKKLLLLDSKVETPDSQELMKQQLEEQALLISKLINLHEEQSKEMQEMKNQLRLLVNKIID